jgi:histidinol dehydrogenase
MKLKNKLHRRKRLRVNCWQEKDQFKKVGLYIPGGTAPLFSTVLMLAVPASAGCKEIVLCSTPDKNGNINPRFFMLPIYVVSPKFKRGIQA